jgi:phosphate transport system substrate-binding protein
MKLLRPAAYVVSMLSALAATLLLALAPAGAAASHALIQGSGSSWAANAINQWVADVASNGMQVVFTANGAAQGRKDFANKATDFGVSDIGYQGTDPATGQSDTSQGRAYAYLPIAAGGTAFPYNVQVGGQQVRNLRLSGETLVKIFSGQITNWDDPEITSDNNGNALPSIPIIPVVHSEGAGVTYEFTRYAAKSYPQIWGPCNGGKAVPTEYFPLNCGAATGPMKAQSGSDGVMNFIKSSSANGAIGIEEYSYPLLANFPSIKMLNSAGYYTLPTQYNVAVALTKAVINYDKSSPNYLLENLDNVYTNPDKRTYPLSSYVYAIIPTAKNDARMTTAKRQTVADFLYYSICQGQSEIGPIGYSSLPVNLVEAGFQQVDKLKTADPAVDLTNRDVSTCHNPTFIAGKPTVNHLAQIAPNPPACDKTGAGPCAAGVGAYNGSDPSDSKNNQVSTNSATGQSQGGGATTGSGSTGGSGGSSGSGGTGGSGTSAGGSTTTVGTGSAGGTVDSGVGAAPGGTSPQTSDLGLTGAATGTTTAASGTVVATTLAADSHTGPSGLLSLLVIALFVLAVAAPIAANRLLKARR